MTAHGVPGLAENTVLTIAPGALDKIREHLWPHDGHETGGILLGHERIGRLDIAVAGGPGPSAVRTSTSFHRDLHHARALAAEAWSAQQAVWIGEWHTHPHGPPHPSGRDLSTYRNRLFRFRSAAEGVTGPGAGVVSLR